MVLPRRWQRNIIASAVAKSAFPSCLGGVPNGGDAQKKACAEGQEGVASAPSNRKADRSNIKASASDRMNTGVHKKKNLDFPKLIKKVMTRIISEISKVSAASETII